LSEINLTGSLRTLEATVFLLAPLIGIVKEAAPIPINFILPPFSRQPHHYRQRSIFFTSHCFREFQCRRKRACGTLWGSMYLASH